MSLSVQHSNNNIPNISTRALVPFQEKAVAILKKVGLPSRTDEVWRASQKMAVLSQNELPSAEQIYLKTIAPSFLSDVDAFKIIFVNGFYNPDLSDDLPEGLDFVSLSDAVVQGDSALEMIDSIQAPYAQGYKHLNSVMCRDGAVLNVGRDARIEKPIHLVFKNISEKTIAYTRTLISVAQGAEVTFVSEHQTEALQQENHVTELFVGGNAQVTFLKVAADIEKSAHIASFAADVARDATLNVGTYCLGSDFYRTETNIHMSGQGGNVNCGTASILAQDNIAEHVSTVLHNVPHCNSSQLFQSLCDDAGRSMVQSKTVVARDAQKTDGQQMLRGLLMSEQANAFAKPELEIYADDVKCAHGSTIGQLDENALYYMRARGIPLGEAKALLTEAFVGEALDVLNNDALSSRLMAHFSDYIRQGS